MSKLEDFVYTIESRDNSTSLLEMAAITTTSLSLLLASSLSLLLDPNSTYIGALLAS